MKCFLLAVSLVLWTSWANAERRGEVTVGPELSYGGPAKHMMIRKPSGNRLEFIHRLG